MEEIKATWEHLTKMQKSEIAEFVKREIQAERERLAGKIRNFAKQLEGMQVDPKENLELLAKIIESEDK